MHDPGTEARIAELEQLESADGADWIAPNWRLQLGSLDSGIPSGHSSGHLDAGQAGEPLGGLVEKRSARRPSPPKSSSKYLLSMASKKVATFRSSNEN